MAQLQLQPATSGKKNRMLRHQLRIDMTPMVDLGFLLITFFIVTTTMAEAKADQIVIPSDGPSSTTSDITTVNAILGKDNKVFFYNGKWEEAMNNNAIAVTNYNVHTGLGNYIRAKQEWLDTHYSKKRGAMVLLIKPTEVSTYQNFVDAIDEVMINDVKTYVVVQPTAGETKYAATH